MSATSKPRAFSTRVVALDVETTGLSAKKGDRVVEIGCVALEALVPTGEIFHVYLNPEMSMPEEARKIHGLSNDFLASKPRFAEEAQALVDFLGDSRIVAHNAEFDLGFLAMELAKAGRPSLANAIEDTLAMARERWPGQGASLDAVARRLQVPLHRGGGLHGALLDAKILASVYARLRAGDPAARLSLDADQDDADQDAKAPLGALEAAQTRSQTRSATSSQTKSATRSATSSEPLMRVRLDAATQARHTAFVAEVLGESAHWRRTLTSEQLTSE